MVEGRRTMSVHLWLMPVCWSAQCTPKVCKNPRNRIMEFPAGGTNRPPTILHRCCLENPYTLTANIHRDNEQQNGVLAAQGDRFSGYSLYIQNNHLVYERNTGVDVVRIVSEDTVPAGDSTVQFSV